jgi:dipeptidyl aminopeptidase/acylaminoacyl peptidase
MGTTSGLLRAFPIAVACAALTVTGCRPATREAPAPTPTYSARDFFETTAVTLPAGTPYAFSPDGSRVLVTTDGSGVFNAGALPVAGGDPLPLTQSSTNAVFAISYFPSDDRVLVQSDQGGNELRHIYVRERDGELTDLTPGEKHTSSFLAWSADGGQFWIATNERNPQAFDVYAYDAATLKRRLVFQNPGGFMPSAVSPDARWLALSRAITSADADIYLVDLSEGSAAKPVLATPNDAVIAHGIFGFTPDSGKLVYATDEHGEFTHAWTHDLATGEKAELLKADWDVLFLGWSPSGRFRVSAVNADASTVLSLLDESSGRPVALQGIPAGDIAQVRFSRDESRIAFTVSSDTSPPDVFVADVATGEARRLTRNLNPAIDESVLVEGEVVRFPSFDGMAIPAILFRPRGASAENPVPAIIEVHGGPGGQSRKGYDAACQHLVNHGYAVLRVNNRGSSGYGKTFFHLDDRRHGEVDLDDVVHGKKYLQTLDWVRKDRIAVMGGSYGGFMVAAALAFRPEEFTAGVNIFGVTNWVRTLKSIPPWWGAARDALYDELGDPATDAERLQRISPLFHAANIVRPLLVIQGANDPRVLQVESDELVEAARQNGVDVEYVVFPDEGHGFRRRENRITASDSFLAFLDRHLKEAAPAAE